MLSGLPVVSTYHAGIPEVVTDGYNGFLVPEHDVDALARKTLYLIEHPELWQDLARRGRSYVEQYHDIDKQAEALEQKLLSLVNGKPIDQL